MNRGTSLTRLLLTGTAVLLAGNAVRLAFYTPAQKTTPAAVFPAVSTPPAEPKREDTHVAALKEKTTSDDAKHYLERINPLELGGQKETATEIARLLADPLTHSAMAAQLRILFDRTHANLFRQLQLTDAQLDQLRDLLATRFLETTELFSVAGSDPASNVAILQATLQNGGSEADSAILELLGPEKASQYERLENLLPYHNQLKAAARMLEGTPNAVSQGQLDQYAQSMIASTEEMSPLEREFMNASHLLPTYTPTVDDRAVATAKSVLNPEQFRAFEAKRDEQETRHTVKPRSVYRVLHGLNSRSNTHH